MTVSCCPTEQVIPPKASVQDERRKKESRKNLDVLFRRVRSTKKEVSKRNAKEERGSLKLDNRFQAAQCSRTSRTARGFIQKREKEKEEGKSRGDQMYSFVMCPNGKILMKRRRGGGKKIFVNWNQNYMLEHRRAMCFQRVVCFGN